MSTAVFQVDAEAGAIDEDAIATMAIDIIEHEQRQPSNSTAAANLKLARSLLALGSLTLVADVSAMLYQPARGPVFASHGAAYYGILAAVLAVVALEMATAYRLQQSSRLGQAEAQAQAQAHGRRVSLLAFGKALLVFASLLFLFVLAVGGFALTNVKAP